MKELEDIIVSIINSFSNRKTVNEEFDKFFNIYQTKINNLELDEIINFFKFVADNINSSNISYDIKTYLYYKTLDYSYSTIKKYRNYLDNNMEKYFDDMDVAEANEYEKYTDKIFELDYYILKSNDTTFKGFSIISKYSDEIIKYLDSIGYDLSKLNSDKYFLLIEFNYGFNVSYYPKDRKISPLYCKNLDELKKSLEIGERLDSYYEITHGHSIYRKVMSISTYEELVNLLKVGGRNILTNVSFDNKLSEDEIKNILNLNISNDIKIHFIMNFVNDDEWVKYSIYFKYDIFKYFYIMEIENNKENIIRLEKLGYKTLYSDFNRLFIDLNDFSFFNETHFLFKNEYMEVNNIELDNLIK